METSIHYEKTSLVLVKLAIYIVMMMCAIIILFTQPYLMSFVRESKLAPQWLLVGPSLFLGLFIISIILHLLKKSLISLTLLDLAPIFIALLFIFTFLPSSFREYQVRIDSEILGTNFVATFMGHQDARVRALAIMALSHSKFDDQSTSSLIHEALLDKDPVVQQAAKLVIEDNLGIRFKNGAEGTRQAQDFMRQTYPSALLTKKGSP